MGFLDGLEKLINEHGSAVILKERIELANDKFSALEQKLSDSELRVKKLEPENERLSVDLQEAQVKIRNLEEQLVNLHDNALSLKYGVYWDKNGNPFCPKCKLLLTRIVWATHLNRQVQSFRCSCSELPIVLLAVGEPIQAPEAMKLMASA